MKKSLLVTSLTALCALSAVAETSTPIQQTTQPDSIQNIALPTAPLKTLDDSTPSAVPPLRVSRAQLLASPQLTQDWLNLALQQRNPELIQELLAIYRTFAQHDPILIQFAEATLAQLAQDYPLAISRFREILAVNPDLNPVRIELAKSLFQDRQDNAARDQFEKAKSAVGVPAPVVKLIDSYLDALQQRSGWQSRFSAYYLRDGNVNNTSSNREIENTGFVKDERMLPQSAHGIAYSFSLERDFNLSAAHYLHFGTELFGKNFWDNHAYDDIYHRTYLGYSHKSALQTLSVLPFYEKRWYGNQSYKWANGVRGEYRRWLNANWQLSTALEHAEQHYYDNQNLNGHSQLASATLLWLRSPRQFFYFGSDYNREQTRVWQYSNNTRTLRLGWGQEWQWGTSSRLGLSYAQRHYKDQAKLGEMIPLGKVRNDKIYNVNLTLWKRDWHVWGITPKLHFNWKKQASNLPSMYSYTQKNANLIFEKTF
ncbi:surface lipoprotein assembly modifier [Testudinibacter sp. P80/BLE/0925]|uniref:surface lipoprotein assembly modifier n=1 Tax=Testudinibacter sp. TW-1 TaxID=3417757 RepID=UPI003D361BFA